MKKLIIICSLVFSFGILAPGQLSAIPLTEGEIVYAEHIGEASGALRDWGSIGGLLDRDWFFWTGTRTFEIEINGDKVRLEAFCLEDTTIGTGFLGYTVKSVSNLDPEYQMAAFYASNYYDNHSQNALWAARTQAIIWETVIETDFTDGLYDLAAGEVRLNNPDIVDDYNYIMSLIGERNPDGLITFLADKGFDSTGWFLLQNEDSQDFLVPGVPVPEPGMLILLGIGLIGLAIFSRQRLVN